MSVQRQGTILFTAILVLVATGVVVQLWLLTVSMEAVFRHDAHTAIPAATCSTVLFAINAGLLRYVFRFDRSLQR
ncbi:MAG: hypothetical protein HIU93_14045 [Acidobacteria bacterium]|nr:hypothetical protein [Acidobacteriota bacterium]MBW4045885.1 hypothetical protein [Acidobacteriota bacterium]